MLIMFNLKEGFARELHFPCSGSEFTGIGYVGIYIQRHLAAVRQYGGLNFICGNDLMTDTVPERVENKEIAYCANNKNGRHSPGIIPYAPCLRFRFFIFTGPGITFFPDPCL